MNSFCNTVFVIVTQIKLVVVVVVVVVVVLQRSICLFSVLRWYF